MFKKTFFWHIGHGGDQIKRKSIYTVILLLAFALILNVNATSATTVSGINSVNSSVKSAISSNMTNQANTISAISSKPNTYKKNLITEKAVSIKVD